MSIRGRRRWLARRSRSKDIGVAAAGAAAAGTRFVDECNRFPWPPAAKLPGDRDPDDASSDSQYG